MPLESKERKAAASSAELTIRSPTPTLSLLEILKNNVDRQEVPTGIFETFRPILPIAVVEAHLNVKLDQIPSFVA